MASKRKSPEKDQRNGMKPVGPLRLVAISVILAAAAWFVGFYAQAGMNSLAEDIIGLGDAKPVKSSPPKPPEPVNFN